VLASEPRSVAESVECHQVGTAAHARPVAGDAGRRSGEPSETSAGNTVVDADTVEVATAAPLRASEAQMNAVSRAVITRLVRVADLAGSDEDRPSSNCNPGLRPAIPPRMREIEIAVAVFAITAATAPRVGR
jgi:hypothetical protein